MEYCSSSMTCRWYLKNIYVSAWILCNKLLVWLKKAADVTRQIYAIHGELNFNRNLDYGDLSTRLGELSSKIIAIFTHFRFLNPRMLPWQHSFCSDCINRMQQCNDCLCPVCRTRFKHADIRDCLFLNNVLEVAARHPCLDEPRTATPPQAVTRDSCEYLVSGYEHVRFFYYWKLWWTISSEELLCVTFCSWNNSMKIGSRCNNK